MGSAAMIDPSLRRPWAPRASWLAGGLAAFVGLLAMFLDDPAIEVAGRALAFYLLSLPIALMAIPGTRERLTTWCALPSSRWIYGAGVLGAIAFERLAQGRPADLLLNAAYIGCALLLTADRPKQTPRWLDLALVALIWLPLEMGYVEGDFTLLRLMGVHMLMLLFVLERPTFSLGRIVPMRRNEWFWGLAMWLAFIAFAIPVAEATGFASFGLSDRSGGDWALFLVSTFWIVALPEEVLFRGTIQALLERGLSNRWIALLLASLLFGLSHLNNKIQGEAMDLRYLLLSSIAGLAYGWAYLKTGNLAAPTLTHFLVDVTWRGFYAGAD